MEPSVRPVVRVRPFFVSHTFVTVDFFSFIFACPTMTIIIPEGPQGVTIDEDRPKMTRTQICLSVCLYVPHLCVRGSFVIESV